MAIISNCDNESLTNRVQITLLTKFSLFDPYRRAQIVQSFILPIFYMITVMDNIGKLPYTEPQLNEICYMRT
jgi:hypothetical protein